MRFVLDVEGTSIVLLFKLGKNLFTLSLSVSPTFCVIFRIAIQHNKYKVEGRRNKKTEEKEVV